jgi:hypothetical protein
MSHGKDSEFFRENVETLRSAFAEILHYHFLLFSALIPEIIEAIQAGISKALAERSEERAKAVAEIDSYLDPKSEKAALFRIPRKKAISSFSVGKAIEFDFKYLERGEAGALKAVLDHQQEAFELFVTMIPPQVCPKSLIKSPILTYNTIEFEKWTNLRLGPV